MIRKLLVTLTMAVIPTAAQAQSLEGTNPIQEEIIVSTSRAAQPRLQVGSAVDVLSEEDIAARQQPFLSDLLRDLPGLAVNRAGPTGAFTQVRLRGAEANHTLVVIDGIEVGDPFNAGEFEFAHLLSADASRVEVLRGPQSALWGSDAIGGVINIQTGPRDWDAGVWTDGFAESGSFGTALGRVGAGNKGPWGHLRGSVALTDVRGISASPTGSERDGYDNLTVTFDTKVKVTDIFDVTVAVRHMDATAQEDTQDFDFLSPTQGLVIDSDTERRSKRWYGRASANVSTMNGLWTHGLSVALTDSDNKSFAAGAFDFGSQGRKWDVEYWTDVALASDADASHALSAVLEYEDLTYENFGAGGGPENQRQTGRQWSGALQYRISMAEQLFAGASVRFDDHQRFDNETTYRLTAAWAIPDTPVKLRGSFGTGVAQPSFFELFGFNPNFFFGNPDLKPETSTGWDAGLDYVFDSGRGLVSLTYFDSNLKNEVFNDFAVFPFTVSNRAGKSTRDGFEVSLQFLPMEGISLAAAYSYVDAKDDRGQRELRRPKHLASLNLTTQFMEDKAVVDLGLNYNGAMRDSELFFATPETVVTLDDYILGTVSASYAVSNQVWLIGRIENAFDEAYEEVFGFASPGLGAYAGIRISLNGR